MKTAFYSSVVVAIRNFRFIALALLLLSFPVGDAQSAQSDFKENHFVDILSEKRGNDIDLVASLVNCTDATITLNADLEGMSALPPVPLTVDSAGRSRFIITTLSLKHGASTWHYDMRFDASIGGRLKSSAPAAYVYTLPFRERSVVIQGARGRFSHGEGTPSEEAIDFRLPIGTTVLAAREGIVTAFRSDCTVGGTDRNLMKIFNFVMIRHDDGTYAEYEHLAHDGVLVKLGGHVVVGQPIGISGNTGYSTGPHLHFEVCYAIDGTRTKSVPVQFKGRDGLPFTAVKGMECSNP